MDSNIGNLSEEKQYCSMANAKGETVENDRKNSDSSGAGISEIQTSSEDVESHRESVHHACPNSTSLKKSVTHIECEASDTNHEILVIRSSTKVNLEESAKDEAKEKERERNEDQDALDTAIQESAGTTGHSATVKVDAALLHFVKGKGGKVHKKIQEEMGVKISFVSTQEENTVDSGIDKSIFIKPATFHLTVLMLKLWNKERIAQAAEVLQKASPQVNEALEGRPIAVSLKGLLHATLMNTSHRKRKRSKGYKRNLPFDARPIVERYGSADWGEYVIHEAHLSQRFSYDENGYYHCCGSIPFPKIMQ